MDALGHQRFAVVGHDTGFAISYALAADHPDRVDRVALAEIPGSPGTVQAAPLFLPGPLNDRLWHLGFNRIDTLNEQLVAGWEDAFYRWEFDAAAKRLHDDVIDYYVRTLSNPDSLRGSFRWYRALDMTIAHDEQRKTQRLAMPVLAIGGETSFGENVGEAVQVVAGDVQSVVIPRRRTLSRRGGSRGDAGGADRVPGPVPGWTGRGARQAARSCRRKYGRC
jgi:pimeloyl-ACP methyl ester carboxylesterase